MAVGGPRLASYFPGRVLGSCVLLVTDCNWFCFRSALPLGTSLACLLCMTITMTLPRIRFTDWLIHQIHLIVSLVQDSCNAESLTTPLLAKVIDYMSSLRRGRYSYGCLKQAVITALCSEQVMGSVRVTAVNIAFTDYRCTLGIRIQVFQGTCLST